MQSFLHLLQKQTKKIIGLMSGTSADGVDAALVEIQGHGLETQIRLIAFETTPFNAEVRSRIFKLFQPESSRIDELCQMNFLIGERFADAALTVIRKAGLTPEEIDLIGSHGQTVYHLPPKSGAAYVPSTLQIGESAVIAHRTGIPTIADFRVADAAAGGQGAPLVPYVDFLLFRRPDQTVALQNIGGISNLTLIPAGADAGDVIASDTGPGNMIIDAIVEMLSGGEKTYDDSGKMAAQGQACEPLLRAWLTHPFLRATPPKTTGREDFGRQFAQKAIQEAGEIGLTDADLVATATEFTARTIFDYYRRFVFPQHNVDAVRISGGGSHNLTLMGRLKALFQPIPVTTVDFGDAKEAIAFAALANEALHSHPANLPQVTGASGPKILGKLTPP
jgi:anhydro-N-acetylmuramic acid kinase